MPNPTSSDLHVNAPLTDVSVAYMQDQSAFIAAKVFPNVPVKMKSDLYYKYNQEDFMTSQMQERAPGAESAGSGWRVSTDSYFCRDFALHDDIPDQNRANADPVFDNLDTDSVNFLTQNAMIKRELDFASNYFTAGVWSYNTTGQAGASNMAGNLSQYWNIAASTPIEDMRYAMKAIHKGSGIKPNFAIFGASAWYALLDNADFLDRVKYSGSPNTNPARNSQEIVATILGLKNIYVMEAVYNTAAENAGFTGAFVGDKAALIGYAAPAAGKRVVSAGYTFSWTGWTGAGIEGNRIKKFRLERNASDRIEIEMAYALKVVAPSLGFYFGTCVQ